MPFYFRVRRQITLKFSSGHPKLALEKKGEK